MGAASAPELAKAGTGRVVPAGGIAYWLSGALAVAAALSALLTYLVSDVLRGPAVMNGSARGTALVVLLVGVPVLACSLVLAWRGSAIAVVTWLAAVGFLLYNALMFVFATPVNRLFLLYLAMLSLAAWSAGTLLWHTDAQALGRLIPARAPVRLAAGYLWAVVILNGGAWLVRILPTLASSGEPAYLRGTGMTTNIVFVQDLALWVPLMAVAAAWLWQRKPRGYLLGGASIVMGVIESISIAADQWYGHAADPASTVVSAVLTPIFAALAVLSLARGLAAAAGAGRGQGRDAGSLACPAAPGLGCVAYGWPRRAGRRRKCLRRHPADPRRARHAGGLPHRDPVQQLGAARAGAAHRRRRCRSSRRPS